MVPWQHAPQLAVREPRPLPHLPQDERKAAERREGALVNYRQQIGFAVHILAMMAAFYAFGHVAGMALTSNRTLVRQRP